jgi:HK97 gp10 family phage protein
MGVSGFRELEQNLERTERAVSDGALVSANKKGAQIIAEGAKSRAPRRTGRLAESIDHEIDEASSSEVRERIGPKVFYGGLVELGTAQTAAKPYLRPALDERGDAAVNATGKDLWARIRRVLR